MKLANDFAIDSFRRALAHERLGHAYLLTGLTGEQADALGREIAQLLLCDADGCGHCPRCRSVIDGTCSDLHRIAPSEDKRVIPVDDVREKLIREAALKTYQAKRKVFLIIDADAMTDSAANSVLKTLEEPPGGSVMLLMSGRPERLPATIASRCFRLRVGDGAQASDAQGLDPEDSERLADLLATPAEQSVEAADRLIDSIKADSASQRRAAASRWLDGVLVACRDGLLERGPMASVRPEQLQDRAEQASEAQRAIEANGNLDLVLDDFVARFVHGNARLKG